MKSYIENKIVLIYEKTDPMITKCVILNISVNLYPNFLLK